MCVFWCVRVDSTDKWTKRVWMENVKLNGRLLGSLQLWTHVHVRGNCHDWAPVSSVWDDTVGVTSQRHTHTHECSYKRMYSHTHLQRSHFIISLASEGCCSSWKEWGSDPPCSLITVLIMLPGNNMHFIFFPSLCLYHLNPHPPLSHPPSSLMFLSCPLCSNLYIIFSLSCAHSLCPHLCSPPLPLVIFFFLDFQSCLICVARRVPMKERPMLPTHESFTTRQDLQGTQVTQRGAANY